MFISQQNSLYDAKRCKVFLCDLTKDDLVENVPLESVDVVMLIFVLSAIHPEKMHLVLHNIYKASLHGYNNMVFTMSMYFCYEKM